MESGGIPNKVESGVLLYWDVLMDMAELSHSQRCNEHSIHVAAGHFILAVAPAPASKVMKKVRAAFKKGQGQIDLDQLEYELAVIEGVDEDGEDEDEDEDFDISDTVGKALALIKQASVLCIVL